MQASKRFAWRLPQRCARRCAHHLFLTRKNMFGPDGTPCVVLWRPGALDCRVPIPPKTWNGLTHTPPSVGFEHQTSCIWELTLKPIKLSIPVCRRARHVEATLNRQADKLCTVPILTDYPRRKSTDCCLFVVCPFSLHVVVHCFIIYHARCFYLFMQANISIIITILLLVIIGIFVSIITTQLTQTRKQRRRQAICLEYMCLYKYKNKTK